jgi:hypothetical protein
MCVVGIVTSLMLSPIFVMAEEVAVETVFIMAVNEERLLPAAIFAKEGFRVCSFCGRSVNEGDFDISRVELLRSVGNEFGLSEF